jgi:hypothetical protein
MIHNLPKNNNDVRIVCHSHIMQDMVKQYSKIEKYQKIMKEENLWKIFLKNENRKITIIRHANTFANILKAKGKLINQKAEKDAKLSIYGIFTSSLQCDNLKNEEEKQNIIYGQNNNLIKKMSMVSIPNFIYVSVLIRSWMTAICLYLPRMVDNNNNNIDNNFNLFISPYIKENGRGEDNEPDEIDIQIKNIVSFLKFLIKDLDFLDNTLQIKKNSNKINTFFNNKGTINIIKYSYDSNKIEKSYKINKINNIITSTNTNININKKTSKIINDYIEEISNYTISKIYDCEIVDGVKKPENVNFYSRWCEQFSKKDHITNTRLRKYGAMFFKNTTCKSRMEKYMPNLKKS